MILYSKQPRPPVPILRVDPVWIEADGADISDKKLWKLLIDRDMKKKAPEKAAGIGNHVTSKATGNEDLTV